MYILIIIGLILLTVAMNLTESGSYFGLILYVICAIIFTITGIMQIGQHQLLLGIFQFIAAVGSVVGAIISKNIIDED
jgi:hypothetical protein